jgi:hypothetical protein
MNSSSNSLPWEMRKQIGYLKAFWENFKLSMLEPGRFFESVPSEGDYISPLFYGMICISIGMIFTTLYQFLFRGLSLLLQLFTHHPANEIILGTSVSAIITLAVVVASPIAGFVNLFLYSAIFHFFLWMVGGNKKGYEATFRVFAYAQGPQLLQIVPILGAFVTFVWQYVLLIIGFKKVHQATTGQAVATVLLPIVFICGLTFFLIAGIVALVVFFVTMAHRG